MASTNHLRGGGSKRPRAVALRSDARGEPYPYWLPLQLAISGVMWGVIVLGVLRLT
jgi:hypothetical protein